MINKEQALIAPELHFSNWTNSKGECQRLRRNGQTKTWKTRPNEFRFPGKWGLRDYHHVTEINGYLYHTPEDCPAHTSQVAAYHLANTIKPTFGKTSDVETDGPGAFMLVTVSNKQYRVIMEPYNNA